MVNKIFATIVMGLVGVFVIGFPVILVVVPLLNGDPNPAAVVAWTFVGPGIAVVATIRGDSLCANRSDCVGSPLPPERAGEPRAVAGRHRRCDIARASRFAARRVIYRRDGRENRLRARRHDRIGYAGARWPLFGRDSPGARLCHLAERTAPLIANFRGAGLTIGPCPAERGLRTLGSGRLARVEFELDGAPGLSGDRITSRSRPSDSSRANLARAPPGSCSSRLPDPFLPV
jgi:hypothetical protein